MTVGFVGLGNMGGPMARNLLRAGVPLVVWNRTAANADALVAAGAARAETIDDLCARCGVLMVMLLDEDAIDAVFARGTTRFDGRVRGKTFVQLGTTSPDYSQALERDILASGGRYVEAPVSGSRVPAERGQLVGMVAGEQQTVADVLPLLSPLCTRVFQCGAVPAALRLKLAANHFLIGLVAVLAEAVHAARAAGVDLALLRDVLDAGPMASDVSRIKLDKLVRGDFDAQAAIHDVANIARLVSQQCSEAGADAPLMRQCTELFQAADACGHGALDMAAVIHAFAAAAAPPATPRALPCT
jgi:3-hydroxyisobutyrate dehydrogenase